MGTKTPTGKAPKGSVQVITSNDRLQLRFRYAGKRRYLSLGLYNDRDDRLAAEMKARQIELDILSGNFDETLDKYRILVNSKVAADIPQSQAILLLSELWEKYTEYRRSQIAETTLRIQYAAVTSHINKLPSALQTISKENAVKIRDFYLKQLTVDTTKRTITQISACCDWAVDSDSIAENPFRGMAKKLQCLSPRAERMTMITMTISILSLPTSVMRSSRLLRSILFTITMLPSLNSYFGLVVEQVRRSD